MGTTAGNQVCKIANRLVHTGVDCVFVKREIHKLYEGTNTMNASIALLDLNYTLVANSRELRGCGEAVRVEKEQYRQWLVDMLVSMNFETVIMLTARPIADREWTLESIARKCGGWLPDVAIFNTEVGLTPQSWKHKALEEIIFPNFGNDASQYFAFESNTETWRVYKSYGISGFKVFEREESENVMPKTNWRSEQQRLFRSQAVDQTVRLNSSKTG